MPRNLDYLKEKKQIGKTNRKKIKDFLRQFTPKQLTIANFHFLAKTIKELAVVGSRNPVYVIEDCVADIIKKGELHNENNNL